MTYEQFTRHQNDCARPRDAQMQVTQVEEDIRSLDKPPLNSTSILPMCHSSQSLDACKIYNHTTSEESNWCQLLYTDFCLGQGD